jgi:hypothetical protein
MTKRQIQIRLIIYIDAKGHFRFKDKISFESFPEIFNVET